MAKAVRAMAERREMTHPDIVRMERLGRLNPEAPVQWIDTCQYCGAELYDDGLAMVESTDGRFCDMDCCHGYYEIHST